MIKLNYYLVDVFAKQQFGGNQLAVFPDADNLSTETMQKIANEFNLAETSFIQKAKSRTSDCTVRIFTPQKEMPMAGHPTIGTAYVILKNNLLPSKHKNKLIFDEGVGPIPVSFEMEETVPTNIFMQQPLPQFSQISKKEVIAEILSIKTEDIKVDLPVETISCGVPYMIVPLKNLESVQRVSIREDLLATYFGSNPNKELFVFSQETTNPESSVHCRMFAPELGVVEDAATGSAHGPLGAYLVKYNLHSGKNIISEQGYEMGRPSLINVNIEQENGQISKVLVGGDCIEVGQGVFYLHN